MNRQALLPLLLVAALSGCSKHATEPGAVGPPAAVPELIASQPPPRATGVIYDSEIWAQFSRALDPATIGPTSVFLKLDGQRAPIAVTYDALTRRIFLKPTALLELQRTYTADFSTSVRGLDGTPLAPGVFFQFTTNSLRRVPYDYPAPGALEGPLSAIGWGGTQGPLDNFFYDLYASTDSVAVASRSIPPLVHSVFTRFLPESAWPAGRTIYWAITNENRTTHERLNSRMTSFRTIDPSTPIDSVVILTRDHGDNDNRTRPFPAYCARADLPSGPNFNASVHWDLSPIPAGVLVASATVKLTLEPPFAGTVPAANPTIWLAQNDWTACNVQVPGPPFTDPTGQLAPGTAADPVHTLFTSDRLAAFFEALYRGRTLIYGTVVKTDVNTTFYSPVNVDVAIRPQAVIRFYRPPSATAP